MRNNKVATIKAIRDMMAANFGVTPGLQETKVFVDNMISKLEEEKQAAIRASIADYQKAVGYNAKEMRHLALTIIDELYPINFME